MNVALYQDGPKGTVQRRQDTGFSIVGKWVVAVEPEICQAVAGSSNDVGN